MRFSIGCFFIITFSISNLWTWPIWLFQLQIWCVDDGWFFIWDFVFFVISLVVNFIVSIAGFYLFLRKQLFGLTHERLICADWVGICCCIYCLLFGGLEVSFLGFNIDLKLIWRKLRFGNELIYLWQGNYLLILHDYQLNWENCMLGLRESLELDILRRDAVEYWFIAYESKNSFEIRFEDCHFLGSGKIVCSWFYWAGFFFVWIIFYYFYSRL